MLRKDKRIIAVRGDITAGPTLGIDRATLDVLKRDVHIVLALAADINLTRPAIKLVATNIQAPLDLATLASTFAHLERFVSETALLPKNRLTFFIRSLSRLCTPRATWPASTRSCACSEIQRSSSAPCKQVPQLSKFHLGTFSTGTPRTWQSASSPNASQSCPS